MRKQYVLLFMLIILGMQQRAGVQFEKEGTPFKKILALAKKTGKPVMIDFYTESCYGCQLLQDSTFVDPEVAEFSRNFINIKVNTLTKEGAKLSKKFRIWGLPTILFLNSNGEEIDRIIGFRPPKSFLQRIREIYHGMDTFTDISRKYQADSNNVDIAYRWAWKLRDRGLPNEARRIFERVLVLDPENKKGYAPEVHSVLADIASEQRDDEGCRAHLRTIIQKYPNHPPIHWTYLKLAISYRASKEVDKAIKILEQVPDSVVARRPGQFHYYLAYLYMDKGDYEKAFKMLGEISPGQFSQAALDDLYTRIYLKKGDIQKALPFLRKRYKEARGSADQLNNLAWTCVECKVYIEEALEWAQEAVELSKWEKGYIIDTLAELYALKGDYKKAIELEKQAIEKTYREAQKKEFKGKIEKWEALLKEEK